MLPQNKKQKTQKIRIMNKLKPEVQNTRTEKKIWMKVSKQRLDTTH
jgi:hypothetical protein